MADFQQNVATFTRLVDEDLGGMEKKILVAARRTPIGVIIPTLFNARDGASKASCTSRSSSSRPGLAVTCAKM